MVKLILYITFIILFFIYLGSVKITFSPFSIRLETWYRSIGWLLLVIGLGFLFYDQRITGYHEGYNDCIKDFKEQIEKNK